MRKVLIIIFIIIFYGSLSAQSKVEEMKLKFITPFDFQRWTVIDDFNFNKINNWELSPETETKKINSLIPAETIPVLFYKKVAPGVKFSAVQGKRFLTSQYKDNPYCLGVKIVFPEMFETTVFLKPKEDYQLNGVCRKISLWILGRGRNVDFQIVIKDYLNRPYFLNVGKLNYLGWKYWEIDIPIEIPQKFDIYPQRETIKIVGFLVTNHPTQYIEELYQPCYIYIDQLEVLLNNYMDIYPGLEIKDDW